MDDQIFSELKLRFGFFCEIEKFGDVDSILNFIGYFICDERNKLSHFVNVFVVSGNDPDHFQAVHETG